MWVVVWSKARLTRTQPDHFHCIRVWKRQVTKRCLLPKLSFPFADPNRVIHTEMMLVPEEFDNYQIGVDTDVTFCLKELRVHAQVVEFFNVKIWKSFWAEILTFLSIQTFYFEFLLTSAVILFLLFYYRLF